MNNLTTFFYPNQRVSLNSPFMTLSGFELLKFSLSSFCFPFGVEMDNSFYHKNRENKTLNNFRCSFLAGTELEEKKE